MARLRKKYVCNNCGHETMQWFGRCPGCQEWNALVEEIQPQSSAPAVRASGAKRINSRPMPLSQLDIISQHRQSTGLAELDRVLGGGIVPGGVVLVGGEPGAGKSTLLLQVAGHLAAGGRQVLYVSGEESGPQIRLRASGWAFRRIHYWL